MSAEKVNVLSWEEWCKEKSKFHTFETDNADIALDIIHFLRRLGHKDATLYAVYYWGERKYIVAIPRETE